SALDSPPGPPMMDDVRDLETLRARCAAGARPKFLFFWGHTGGPALGKECLSQWYPAAFVVAGTTYPTAEHYMMAGKARLFGDAATAAQIAAAPHPHAAKQLGRTVRDFDHAVWDERRFDIVVDANVAKFGQNPALAAFLAGTSGRVLVEASPQDRIWGIGLAANAPEAQDPAAW